jgi:hypothetical protein
LLPFIEQQNVFNALPTFLSGGDSGTPIIKTFVCPSDSTQTTSPPGLTSYFANALIFGGPCNVTSLTPPSATVNGNPQDIYGGSGQVIPYALLIGGYSRYPASISDGTSNTIIWIDSLAYCIQPSYWYVNSADFASTNWFIVASRPHNTPPNAFFLTGTSGGTCNTYASQNGAYNAYLYLGGQALSGHTAVCMAGVADGSVRPLTQGMSMATYNLALIPTDGLPMPSDW